MAEKMKSRETMDENEVTKEQTASEAVKEGLQGIKV